jgi:hypothetical protein
VDWVEGRIVSGELANGVVTDHERKWVLAVATLTDLEVRLPTNFAP